MSKYSFVYQDPSTFNDGETPYGIYDGDESFQSESIQICKYVARKLGYPVMQLEFNSGSIYACLEEAVSEYSQYINNYNVQNWMFEHYSTTDRVSGSGWNDGTSSTMGTGSHEPEGPHMGSTFFLSKQYGEAANVGGDVTMYTGSIALTSSKQVYDLSSDASLEQTGDRLEIQKVFNEGSPAISRFYDPFAGAHDTVTMLEEFGMGNVSPGVSYILRPISQDITRAQMIETSDKIRKSNYSFELINNKLRIFPIPKSVDSGSKIWFNYYVRSEMGSVSDGYTTNKVSDPSNVPYKFITYGEINSNGRQWIRKMTLALSKELLGIIRSKYASMPLPNGEVSMDGEGLKAEGREEKLQLNDELKEFLEKMSLETRAEAEQTRADANQSVLNKSPLKIYIG